MSAPGRTASPADGRDHTLGATPPADSARLRSGLRRALLLLAVLALMSVAILNGFPIVHYDTGQYVESSFTFEPPPDRPVFYSLFIWLSRAIAPSLWSTVLAQSLLAVLVIHLFLRARAGQPAAARTLSITALLVLLSSVAWLSGLVMADLFSGLMFLAVVTLWLADARLEWKPALFLVLVTAFAVTTHTSHLVILPLFLIAAGWLLRGLSPSRARAYGAASAAFVVALIALPVVNRVLNGRAQGGQVFILARWIGDGALSNLLDERCGIEDYALCPYREQLRGVTSNWFLWSPDSPLVKIGGWERSETTAWPMIRDTLRYRPFDVVRGTLEGFATQLVLFRTGLNHVAYDDQQSVTDAIRTRYPDEYASWQRSLQQRSRLRDVAWAFNWIHVPVAIAGLALLLLIALPDDLGWSPAVAPASRFLARAVLCFVVINAAVCAALSGTSDRYQSRVIWLVALVGLEILSFEWAARDPSGARP